MAGRPLKFKTVEELQESIDKYFSMADEQDEPITITGLALALDTTRETLCDYGEKDQYSDAIKKAKLKVENAYEKRLVRRGNGGDIFALKNFGWVDKSSQELTGANGESLVQKVFVTKQDSDEVEKHINDVIGNDR